MATSASSHGARHAAVALRRRCLGSPRARARQVMWRRVQLDDRMRAACRSSIVRCLLVPVVAVLAFYHTAGEWYACYLLAISFVA